MVRTAIRSTRVCTAAGVGPAVVVIEGERIAEVRSDAPPDAQLHDVGSLVVMPGLVDCHVHINEPGRAEWEGFATASAAAASGGVTSLVDMPLNCIPVTTTRDALR